MEQRQALIGLYKDQSFKAQFISNYLNSASFTYSCSEAFANQEYMNAFSLISGDQQLSLCNVDRIKSAFLKISEMGLSFDKSEKHVHLSALQIGFNKFDVNIVIGYKGTQRLVMETGKFDYFYTQLVHEGDDFHWLGPNESPGFSSSGDTSANRLICGFVVFIYSNGNTLAFKMDGHELEQVANDDRNKAHTYSDQSLYDTEWKNRLFEISLWRNAFNRQKEILLAGTSGAQFSEDGNLNLDDTSGVINEDQFLSDFASQLETNLNG